MSYNTHLITFPISKTQSFTTADGNASFTPLHSLELYISETWQQLTIGPHVLHQFRSLLIDDINTSHNNSSSSKIVNILNIIINYKLMYSPIWNLII